MSTSDPAAGRSGPKSLPLSSAPAAVPQVRELDLRGLNCPMPVLKTTKALRTMAPGARLVVLASDPLAALDIPHFCQENGHVLEASERAGAVLRFTIAKGG